MAPIDSTMHNAPVDVLTSVHIRLDGSLGAVLIGLIFASMLFGITNVQCLIYYQTPSSDGKCMRWTVMFLWLLDAFHLALVSHSMYLYLVTDFGSYIAITRTAWSLCLQVILTITLACTISLFYAYRIWIMSNKNKLLTFGGLALNSVVFVSGIAFGARMFTFKSVLQLEGLRWLAYISFGSAIASNLWSALCLCYFLAKERSGFKTTDTKLNTLMIYVISTGLLTTMVVACCLILMAATPHGYSYIAVYICISKVDFNALLVMLNGRNHVRHGTSGKTSDQGAYQYQLPQIVNLGQVSASSAETSFSTTEVTSDKLVSSVYKA